MTDDKAAPEVAAQPTPMVPIEIDLPGGRPATLVVPIDMTDSEWFGLAGMLPKIRDKLRAGFRPKPAIVTANELPPALPFAPGSRRRR